MCLSQPALFLFCFVLNRCYSFFLISVCDFRFLLHHIITISFKMTLLYMFTVFGCKKCYTGLKLQSILHSRSLCWHLPQLSALTQHRSRRLPLQFNWANIVLCIQWGSAGATHNFEPILLSFTFDQPPGIVSLDIYLWFPLALSSDSCKPSQNATFVWISLTVSGAVLLCWA